MRRILGALVGTASAMIPLSAGALVTPSPSLAQIMLPAPSGYTAQTSSAISGSFTSSNLSSTWGTQAPEAQKALDQDGFVDGYGITVINQTVHHALIEYIVAFDGGQGAMNWLSFTEAGDKADPTYRHSDSISGVGAHYGEHNVYPSQDVSDAFAFVKGNDFFVIGFESTQDDVLNLAISRAKSQYDSAPDSTIPTEQWPENFKSPRSQGAGSQGAAFALGGLMAEGIAALLVVAVILLMVGLAIRHRRGRTITASLPLPMPPGAQMSPDGGFWWDGQQWRPVP